MRPTCNNLIKTLELITSEMEQLTHSLARKRPAFAIFQQPSAALLKDCSDSLSRLESLLRKLHQSISAYAEGGPLPDLRSDMDACLNEFSALSALLAELPARLAASSPERLRMLMKEAETHVNELLGHGRKAAPDDAGVRKLLDEMDFYLDESPPLDVNTVLGDISEKREKRETIIEFNASHRLSPLTIPQDESDARPTLDTLEIAAVTPITVHPGEYGILDIVLFQEAYRHMLDEILQEHLNRKKTAGGVHRAARGMAISVSLSSPDVDIEEPEETQIWQGSYLRFSIDFSVPQDCAKSQILLRALVSFNGIPATRLRILVNLGRPAGTPCSVKRLDIRSAFVSYSSDDTRVVYLLADTIRTCLPDIDLFVDRSCLRPGELWSERLLHEIDVREMLFLFWSRAARKSPYVEQEWQHALKEKGIEGICLVPLESPQLCPPPKALEKLHFGSPLLYLIPEDQRK